MNDPRKSKVFHAVTYDAGGRPPLPPPEIVDEVHFPSPLRLDGYKLVAEVLSTDIDEVFKLTGNKLDWTTNPGVTAFVRKPRSTALGDVIVTPDGNGHLLVRDGLGTRWYNLGPVSPPQLIPQPKPKQELGHLVDLARARTITLAEDRPTAIHRLIEDWRKVGLTQPQNALVIAPREEDVKDLNQFCQLERKTHSRIDSVSRTNLSIREFLYRGDRIRFTEPLAEYQIERNQLGTVNATDASHRLIRVRTDAGERVPIRLRQWPHVALGYALTHEQAKDIHVQNAFVLADKDTTLSAAWRDAYVYIERPQLTPQLAKLVAEFEQRRARAPDRLTLQEGQTQSLDPLMER